MSPCYERIVNILLTVRSLFFNNLSLIYIKVRGDRKEMDMDQFKIHFTDEIGSGTIICNSCEQYSEAMSNLKSNPLVDDIWSEFWDEEEGWQA